MKRKDQGNAPRKNLRPRVYLPDFRNTVLQELEKGKSVADLAWACKVAETTICRWRREANRAKGKVVHKRVFTQEFRLGVIQRVEAGESARSVARDEKIDRGTVWRWRNKFGNPKIRLREEKGGEDAKVGLANLQRAESEQ